METHRHCDAELMVSYGYTLSSEEHAPRELVANPARAEEVGREGGFAREGDARGGGRLEEVEAGGDPLGGRAAPGARRQEQQQCNGQKL